MMAMSTWMVHAPAAQHPRKHGDTFLCKDARQILEMLTSF